MSPKDVTGSLQRFRIIKKQGTDIDCSNASQGCNTELFRFHSALLLRAHRSRLEARVDPAHTVRSIWAANWKVAALDESDFVIPILSPVTASSRRSDDLILLAKELSQLRNIADHTTQGSKSRANRKRWKITSKRAEELRSFVKLRILARERKGMSRATSA